MNLKKERDGDELLDIESKIGNHQSIRSDLRNWSDKGDSSGFQGSMMYLMKDFRHAHLTGAPFIFGRVP
ncbi:MAG: hypothetical protein IZT59_13565 [Verrucomicrobia bacterium]|nr:hypothetical protein [Verrucomicrobiota bacterium]